MQGAREGNVSKYLGGCLETLRPVERNNDTAGRGWGCSRANKLLERYNIATARTGTVQTSGASCTGDLGNQQLIIVIMIQLRDAESCYKMKNCLRHMSSPIE